MKRILSHPWPLALFVLALAPRLYALGDPSMSFYDELTTLARALEPSFAGVLAGAARQYPPYIDFQPPLYYLIIHAVIDLFGHSDFYARLPAALAGAACAPLLYFLGKRLGGRACGIVAGAAVAVNLYQIDVSQQVRLYALFGALTLGAVLALWRALDGGHRRDWAVFALTLTAACATSYLSAATLGLALVLTGLALAFPGAAAPPRSRTLIGLAGSLGLVLAVLAPWWLATSGMRAYLLAPSMQARPALGAALTGTFAAFSSHYAAFLGRPELPWLLAGPAVVGLGLGLLLPGRRRGAVVVALLFATSFALVWGRADSAHHFQVRYVLPCLFAALLAVGLGFSRLTERVAARRVVHVLSLLLGLALAWPSLGAAPFFYRRDDSRLKTLAATLRQYAAPDASLALWREADPWTRPYFETFVRWYLPRAFLPAQPGEDEDGRVARECLLLVPASPGTPPPAGAAPVAELARANIWRLPLANATPLVPSTGTFTASLTPEAAFAELAGSRNIRATGTSLALADRGRSGEASYVFTPLPGQLVALAGLDLGSDAAAYPDEPPSGRVSVLVGSDRDSLTPYRPDRPLPPAASLTVRLLFDPGFDRGPVAVTRLAVTLAVSGDPGPGDTAAGETARRLAINTTVAPCPAGTVYPGRYVLDPSGRACPFADRLANGVSHILGNPGPDPLEPDSLELAGNPGGLWLTLGPTAVAPQGPVKSRRAARLADPAQWEPVRLQIPLAGPAVMAASLTPGETGTAALLPLFTDAGFVPDAWAVQTTAVKLPGQPAASCPDAKPCAVAYELTTGYPARRLDLTWFPRLFGDVAGENGAVAEVAVGDGPFQPVDAFASTRSGRWDGLGVTRRASFDLGRATGTIRVRFRLSGDGAQLWSSPETPLAAVLSLDTRSLPVVSLPPGETALTAECPGQCDATLGFGVE
ncbi:glycosyltransferase family 39 protein [Desulfovibrio sp. TomC]|uniref:glycosyltransferase family 39 protein n=1 Tax=Desulfovibrio sp. TomC TaxID=1562888 RepID=UPI00057489AC|nr:glycosyltransferase family 39 protein [Desulfovibrio sp. TomC]KHK00689.1 putative inner membrane protein [Desulfovibrio sp. TomC]